MKRLFLCFCRVEADFFAPPMEQMVRAKYLTIDSLARVRGGLAPFLVSKVLKFWKGLPMKKLGFLLLFLSLGMFSFGCQPAEKKEEPAAPPAVDEGGGTEEATDAAPGDAAPDATAPAAEEN